MSNITYEWTSEFINEDGNIEDSSFYEKLSDMPVDEFLKRDVGIVRYTGDEINGITQMKWAYFVAGTLPYFFQDEIGNESNTPVPLRFKKELSEYIKNNL